jgi:cytochrome c oxidase subunit 2
MRHPSKLALYLWHSDIGSLGSGDFVASVKLARRPADEVFESAARTTKNATPTPVMTASSYVRVNTKEGCPPGPWAGMILGVYDERRNVGGRTERSAVDDMTVLAARSRLGTRVRPALLALSTLGVLFLTGCSAETVAQIKRFGFPPPASDRSPHILNLWIGTWIAAFAVGFIMWGVILWAANRYKTRHAKMPPQNRYNLPMEIFYTIAPFIIIAVLFYYTVLAQNAVTRMDANPEVTIDVVGQKWSWTFNYKAADNPAVGQDVWEAGTINKTPDLYLPAGKLIQFNLSSPDVIHSFWVPSFYEKLDVIPGRHNRLQMRPTAQGVFPGRCAELCGTYHSAMLFNVHVVSENDYNNYLKSLVAKGQIGEAKGPSQANAPAKTVSEEGTR